MKTKEGKLFPYHYEKWPILFCFLPSNHLKNVHEKNFKSLENKKYPLLEHLS